MEVLKHARDWEKRSDAKFMFVLPMGLCILLRILHVEAFGMILLILTGEDQLICIDALCRIKCQSLQVNNLFEALTS